MTENKLLLISFIAGIFCLMSFSAESKELEKVYVKQWCDSNGDISSGKGIRMSDGTIADCVLTRVIVEFDFDYKWHECHSQDKLYGKLSGKVPLCVLIKTTTFINRDPNRFIKRFNIIAEDNYPKVKLEVILQ